MFYFQRKSKLWATLVIASFGVVVWFLIACVALEVCWGIQELGGFFFALLAQILLYKGIYKLFEDRYRLLWRFVALIIIAGFVAEALIDQNIPLSRYIGAALIVSSGSIGGLLASFLPDGKTTLAFKIIWAITLVSIPILFII